MSDADTPADCCCCYPDEEAAAEAWLDRIYGPRTDPDINERWWAAALLAGAAVWAALLAAGRWALGVWQR